MWYNKKYIVLPKNWNYRFSKQFLNHEIFCWTAKHYMITLSHAKKVHYASATAKIHTIPHIQTIWVSSFYAQDLYLFAGCTLAERSKYHVHCRPLWSCKSISLLVELSLLLLLLLLLLASYFLMLLSFYFIFYKDSFSHFADLINSFLLFYSHRLVLTETNMSRFSKRIYPLATFQILP